MFVFAVIFVFRFKGMNIFLIFSFISFVVYLILGIGVYYHSPRQPLNKVFSAFCVVASYIAITDYMFSSAGSVEMAQLWLRIRFLWPLIIPLQLHFVLMFTKKEKIAENPIYLVLFYLPGLIVSLVQAHSGILYKIPAMEMGMYVMRLNISGISVIILVWINVMLFASIFFCIRHYLNEKKGAGKIKAKIVLIGISSVFLTSVISESGIFNIKISRLMYLSATLFPMVFGYVIWKYRIFGLSSEPVTNKIMSAISDYVILIDDNFRILAVNQVVVDTLGYKEDEIIGKDFHMLFDLSSENQDKRSKLISGNIKNYEINLKKKNGEYLPVLMGTSFMRNKRGEAATILLIGKDISNIKDMREKIRNKERILKLQAQVALSEKMASVGRLAGGVAHEINNPLTIILGYAQVLLRGKDKKDPEYKKLKEIEDQSVRCKRLIEKLVIFSRYSGSQLKEENINELIDKAVDDIKNITSGKNISIVKKYNCKLPNVLADRQQMICAITNLLQNACESMEGSEGEIEILTEKEDNFVKINILDNGVGITKENVGVIFEPFFTTKSHIQAGLGLSMCYEIVKKHKGEILCKSEPGKGSIFEITLPLGQME